MGLNQRPRVLLAALPLGVLASVLSAPANADVDPWTPSVRLSAAKGKSGVEPDIAGNGAGATYAIWIHGGTSVNIAKARAGDFAAPVIFAGSGRVSDVTIDVDPDGNVCAAWQRRKSHPRAIVVEAVCKPKGKAWTKVTALSPRDKEVSDVDGALGDGVYTVVWVQRGNSSKIMARQRSGGSWGKQTVMSGPAFAEEPVVAAAGDGTATVAFSYQDPYSHVGLRQQQPDGSWGDWAEISDPDLYASSPGLFVHPDGSALVAWRGVESGAQTVRARERTGFAAFGAEVDIHNGAIGDANGYVQVEGDPVDGGYAVAFNYIDVVSNNLHLYVTRRYADTGWGYLLDVANEGTGGSVYYDMVIDHDRVLTMVWRRVGTNTLMSREISSADIPSASTVVGSVGLGNGWPAIALRTDVLAVCVYAEAVGASMAVFSREQAV